MRTAPARPVLSKRTRAVAMGVAASLTMALGSPILDAARNVATADPAPATAPVPAAITLPAIADTFVSAQFPNTNFGYENFFDTYGGTNTLCLGTIADGSDVQTISAPEYGLLKFDLSSIPAGAIVTGASLQLTSRAGYAQDGDQNHHIIRLADTTWDDHSVTWNTRPADGTVAAPNPATADGGDIRTSSSALGSSSVYRASCGGDFNGDQVKTFPNNGYSAPSDQVLDRDTAARNFVAAIGDARTTPGAKLAVEVFSPSNPASVAGKAYWARYYSADTGGALAPKLVLTFASASVVQAVPAGSTTAITARVSGAANTTYAVAITTGATCTAGRLIAPLAAGTLSATTDASGSAYVTGSIPATSAFVNASLSSASGELSAPSSCVAVGPDNDAWTRALNIPLTGSGPLTGTSQGLVDTSGGSRWFKFAVQPGSNVRVDLTDLPADYDLVLFRDIGAAFNTLNNTTDLTHLSAEFSPSVFSPSVFSPSVFSPSVFSPDAYAPSVFSPSVFSPSVFSPSVFSPSVFSPSVFSPSVFSPSVFSPSVFSPSVFSPSVFSPSVFSPAGVAPSVFSAENFASAQTRSVIASSSSPGTSAETVSANTWNNTGFFYIRVSGRNGAFSTTSPFTVTVTRSDIPACSGVSPVPGTATASGSGFQTLVLLDSSRLPATQTGNAPADVAALQAKLTAFAARPEITGKVVDLAGDSRVQALNAQADTNTGCPYAKNLVAASIKDIVTAYRTTSPNLKYIVLVGPDGAIPFFRYPDEGLLGPESDYVPPVGSSTSSEASLRLNNVLGQDEYGATTTLSLNGATVPVPDLAVGRLVETAAEASGMIDAYSGLVGGVTATPTSALVTGYDFMADAATGIANDLAAGTGRPVGSGQPIDTLIAPNNISPQDPAAWTAATLRSKLFGARHDLVFLGGHFSANSALAADFATSILSTELTASATDFTNSLVFSIGCHSGYNIVDGDAVPGVTEPVDWAQAFARKKATLIAGTGYQYGDTDFVEYSERIYTGFARQLRYGSGPVAVGTALMRAKQAYLQETPDARGLHRKALIESALFGLPMLSVNLPTGRIAAPTDASIVTATTPSTTDPGLTLGLASVDTSIAGVPSSQAPITVPLKGIGTPDVNATYYTGPDGVVTNPAEPALPLVSKDVSVAGNVLRGVAFRGGNYTDSGPLTPLTGAATSELRGVHAPFVSPVFFPMRLATANYYSALSGGDTRLLVTPAQHKTVPGTSQSTLRLFQNVDLRLFYSNNLTDPALSAAPSISGVSAKVAGGDIVFDASVTGNPTAGIQQTWITYTGDAPRWTSLDLTQCVVTPTQTTLPADCDRGVESTRWVGRLSGGAANAAVLNFMVQSVNGVGLVTMDDALGAYYRVNAPATAAVPAPTGLSITSAPASAVYGSSITVSATLTAAGTPVSARSVTFTTDSSTKTASTDASGVATVTLPITAVPGASTIRATFAGDAGFGPSSSLSQLSIQKAPTALALPQPSSTPGFIGGTATLTDAGGGPLPQRTVYFTISSGATVTKLVPVITDYLGRAVLAPQSVTPGSYTLVASFLGSVPTNPPTLLTDPTYLASVSPTRALDVLPIATAPGPVTVTGPVTVNAGAAYSAQATSTGNPAPTFAFAATPAAPAWLSISPTTGAITGTVPASGVTTFSYKVVATNIANSSTSALVTVTVTPVADLRIDMVKPPLIAGTSSAYVIAVSNLGPVTSTGTITVTDTLPAAVRYRGFVGPGWTCTAVGTTVTCKLARALASKTIAIPVALVVDVIAPVNTVVSNTARVTPTDNSPANNVVTVTSTVTRR